MIKPICKTEPNGDKRWYLNGKLHRTDGPAIEYADDTKVWFLNNKRHRTDGPAIESAGGSKYWFLNGKQVAMEDVLTDPKERFWWRLKS